TLTEIRAAKSVADIEAIRKMLKDLTPEMRNEVLKDLGSSSMKDWTIADVIEVSLADLAMSLSPSHHLTAKDYDAIVEFAKSGKGLCLLADNDPFTTEASELAE